MISTRSDFQNNIQQNKDWNSSYRTIVPWLNQSFRITSNKTRIETYHHRRLQFVNPPFRITSNKTRIETSTLNPLISVSPIFQNNIQQNKDWNLKTK